MKTGNTIGSELLTAHTYAASMEPGHEDREYRARMARVVRHVTASMEPGHEDREYEFAAHPRSGKHRASMEPGHEDREYALIGFSFLCGSSGLNGARS